MNKTTFLFLSFFCIGITTEIIFTSFFNAIVKYTESSQLDLRLLGHSYFWMFFIYGLVAFLFPPVYSKIEKYFVLIRLLIYAIGIFIIEFVSGFILDITTGSCPWHYTSKFAICGYIRLDYLFFWMIFGFLVERIYLYLNKLYLSAYKN